VVARRRSDALRELLRARARLASPGAGGTDCVRLCAGAADGLPGLLVDRFGPLIVAVDYVGAEGAGLPAEGLLRLVRDDFPAHHVVAKSRLSADGTNPFAIARHIPEEGPAAPLVATERGLRFEIGLDPAHDFGLFLDAAKARAFVRASSAGRRVLNLFSYAGAFGIAAAAGGAAAVTNVDPNREYLAWSLRNARLNGVTMRVLPDTAQAHLAKHRRRLERDPRHARYDLVIVDPPAFGVGRGNQRVLRLLWPQLFEGLRALRPRQVVLMCNDKSFRSRQSFGALVEAELGASYRFARLGTHWTMSDLAAERAPLEWAAGVEDPTYVEPVVFVGSRRPG
jgi:23S rRNA G2069 N7-methylase RlmK/C1962 C5-methylase RlmI